MNRIEIIDVTITPYALAHILNAMALCGIHTSYLTVEDNDLHLRIPKEVLEGIVYPRTKKTGDITAPTKPIK